jgi:signal peptidase I
MSSPATPSAPQRRLGLVLLVVAAVIALGTTIYLTNPLRTADDTPAGRMLGFRVYRNPSSSMEPTIHRNAFFLVSAWPIVRNGPQAGDVVVYRYPIDPSMSYVKRVIAVGGSTIEIRNDVVYVGGKQISEPYLLPAEGRPQDLPSPYSMPATPIPANYYFVMGDNRNNSQDSRHTGPIPRSAIVGKALIGR